MGGSSNGVKTCTYNHCYVYKQDLSCKTGGAKQRLNGCCAEPSSCSRTACGFETDCKSYAYNFNNAHSESVKYCLTYHKNYKIENTAAKTDDQADHKLQIDKLYVYTACAAPSPANRQRSGARRGFHRCSSPRARDLASSLRWPSGLQILPPPLQPCYQPRST